MRATTLIFAAALAAGCSSSSGSDVLDGGQEDHQTGHPKHGKDAGADARSVCNPASPKDAGQEAEGGEGGRDGATLDARADAPTDAAKEAGVDAGCEGNCALRNPTAYAKFVEYELDECGCTPTGPCYSDCHASTTAAPTSSCGMCLTAQGNDGLSSTCTLAAAADCSMDTECTAFQACAGACPM